MQQFLSSDCCFCQDYESSAVCSVTNDAVPAEVDETQNPIIPVVVWETLDLNEWVWNFIKIVFN